jgi:hypothetical protein
MQIKNYVKVIGFFFQENDLKKKQPEKIGLKMLSVCLAKIAFIRREIPWLTFPWVQLRRRHSYPKNTRYSGRRLYDVTWSGFPLLFYTQEYPTQKVTFHFLTCG